MERVSIIGLDIAKNTFQLHGSGADGAILFRKALPRSRVLEFLSRLAPCIVAMEACSGSHYWGREISALGHEVRLLAPRYVKPYVKRQKNDAADAEAIAEAASRPSMRFVAVKSAEQQGQAMLLKTRDLLAGQRTQTINALRGHLAEHGVIAPKGTLIEIFRRCPINAAVVEWYDTQVDPHYKAAWFPDRIPVLIIAGDSDHIIAQHTWDRAQFTGPNVTRILVADAGHWPWLDNPVATLEALRGVTMLDACAERAN